ncbi:MAG: KpsF/GutQ family sugar-phosphate isomerase [Bacteroidetes bacterium]|nr:KpsF/GutQ family sugar-phosphate isomerase [Bacteroidota bacterium]
MQTKVNLIKSYGIQAITDELNSLSVLPQYADDSFCRLVELLLDSTGRAVVTGIGKSAIIAQKIVATMNSTGQPAVFMHAADAIHGDLGIIQPGDVVIAISKSGNTPEIKALAPLLKSFGNPLVVMVGNIQSELASQADIVINTTVDKEACPNNLAPTSSTTAQLLMGDAIAIALLRMRNFSGSDFSKYHPGGALGKKLYLRCGEIAARNEKPSVAPSASVNEVIVCISKSRLGAAAVLDGGSLLGIITDGDIRRMLEKHNTLQGITAADIMSRSPKTLDAETLAVEAIEWMSRQKISQIIVLSDQKYAGMVHFHDLNREGLL